MATTPSTRPATGVVAAGLLLLSLAGCSGDAGNTTMSGVTSAAGSAGAAASSAAGSAGAAASSAAGSAGAAASSAAGSAGSAGSSAGAQVGQRVNCSGTSCSVTLSTGGKVEVLGTQLSLQSVSGGQATLSVGGQTVSCGEGEKVSAGPVGLTCTGISADSVTLTAALG